MAKYNKRYISRITLEATTPLSISSGLKDIKTESLVVKDINGLPYIPGTSIAGVLRHSLSNNLANDLFGFQSQNDGEGSKVIISEARLLNADGSVLDGIIDIDFNDPFLSHYKNLPVRQHVNISEYGTSTDSGKFDEQIVYKGSRFCFEVELVQGNNSTFNTLLAQLLAPDFRLGSGTRSGFGEMKVITEKSFFTELNLDNEEDLDLYLDKSSSLADLYFWDKCKQLPLPSPTSYRGWTIYILTIQPEDFILFSSGFGNNISDINPVRESIIEWDENGQGHFVEHALLIPASSVKGAISHRVAYHYNKLQNWYIEDKTARVGSENEAVLTLFGGEKEDSFLRGNLIMSDIIQVWNNKDKLFTHIAIDNFTGGAIDGALFNEQVIYAHEHLFTLKILVSNTALNSESIQDAFEKTLNDICSGMLPLGGGTNRGHGCFLGTYQKITQS